MLLTLSKSEMGIDCGSINIPALAYADDVVLLASNPQNLQSLINSVDTWCTKNGIEINKEKTKVMHVRRKRCKQSLTAFACGPHHLQYSTEYKYLGLWLNEHLDTKKMVDKVSISARHALTCLIAKAKEICGLSFHTYTYLYNTLVVPIIEYSSCIWGFEQHDCIELIQNKALRFYLGVGKNYPRAALQGEMGWIPINSRINSQLISWWLKINNLEENRLSY